MEILDAFHTPGTQKTNSETEKSIAFDVIFKAGTITKN